jgi:hypothetical protein
MRSYPMINSALCHKVLWGSGSIVPGILNRIMDEDNLSASLASRFTKRIESPSFSG